MRVVVIVAIICVVNAAAYGQERKTIGPDQKTTLGKTVTPDVRISVSMDGRARRLGSK
jgi:hypothetical protein